MIIILGGLRGISVLINISLGLLNLTLIIGLSSAIGLMLLNSLTGRLIGFDHFCLRMSCNPILICLAGGLFSISSRKLREV